MKQSKTLNQRLRQLPGVDHLLELIQATPHLVHVPRTVCLNAIRNVIEETRKMLLQLPEDETSFDLSSEYFIDKITNIINQRLTPNLLPVINATGIIIHTNLGRSLLPQKALDNLYDINTNYSNLEFDLDTGNRGERYSHVEQLLCELSGAEAAIVVNNNAAAVLLSLNTIADSQKVIISRGELVEIGGSFRIPDVMEKSGARLVEVGTTNRTHLIDYENKIDNETSLLLKVHQSNYAILGFTSEVTLTELTQLAAKYRLPVMHDLGSGSFLDLTKFGLKNEPTVQDSVKAGADIITFSGDKMLGGPQAGIIVGKKEFITRIKTNPLTRALRIDKLTLAALESTLRLYQEEENVTQSIPTLSMLTEPVSQIEERAEHFYDQIISQEFKSIDMELVDIESRAGGGSLPQHVFPSKGIQFKFTYTSAITIEKYLRHFSPPIIGRIQDDFILFDFRTIRKHEMPVLIDALIKFAKGMKK